MTQQTAWADEEPAPSGRASARGCAEAARSGRHQAADILSISRSNLALFLHERIDLLPEMALRLEAAFGLQTAMLVGMQADHDLSRVRARQAELTAKVRRVWPASA